MAELIQTKDVLEVLKKLPKMAWLQDLTEPNKVILVKRGSVGYWPARIKATADEAKAYCAKMNGAATAAQIEAMEAGSHFGWDIPAANPDNYNADGSPRRDHTDQREAG